MATQLAFDIETVPNENMREMWDEKYLALPEDKRKPFSEAALSPVFGKVVAYGVYGTVQGNIRSSSHCSESEKELLKDISKMLNNLFSFQVSQTEPLIITFNGINFDLPFVWARMALRGVPTPALVTIDDLCRRYRTNPHFDIRQVMNQWNNFAPGSLEDVAMSLYGKRLKESIDYKELPDIVTTEDGREEIQKAVKHHARLTFNIYKSIKPYF